jgi:hypothetical protein
VALALLACSLSALWVATEGPVPTRGRDEVAVPSPSLVTARPSRPPSLPAVLAAVAAITLGASWLLVRRPALRLVRVTARVTRGRGPPRSTST